MYFKVGNKRFNLLKEAVVVELSRIREFSFRGALWMIVLSQVFYVLPYAESMMFYRIGMVLSLLMLGRTLKQEMLSRTEFVVLVGSIMIPVAWFALQAAFFAKPQILFTALIYVLFVLTGFVLYRYTTLQYICRIIRIFVVINLLLIPIWFFAGDIEFYMPEDPRLEGSVVMSWHDVYQKIVVYDEDDSFFPRSAGFTRNPNNLAFLAFIGTIGLFVTNNTRKAMIGWGLTLCILLFITQSRGALLSSCLFTVCIFLGRIKKTWQKVVLVFSVVAGGSLLLVIMSAFRGGNDVSSSRTEHWKLALSTVDFAGLNLFFGTGLNQSFEKLSGVLGGLSYGIDSTPITLLIEHGIVGSFILLASFGATVLFAYFSRRKSNNIADSPIFIAFFIVWTVYSVFETALYRNTFYQTLLTFMIMTFASKKPFRENPAEDVDKV